MMTSSSLSSPTKLLGIGARIAQVRFPLSQTKFAISLGIHKNTLMQYEQEEKPPDSEFLTRIYEVYRVDPIWLFTGESARVISLTENIRGMKPVAIQESFFISQLEEGTENRCLLYMEGESMQPTVDPGDVIMANLQDTAIRDGGIYALKFQDVLLIKRLRHLSGEVIQVSSDNPDYESWTSNIDAFSQLVKIIGRAECVLVA
jgi:transcriptional regulator with XRE-family HTH domain